jgi:ACS family hexuronate transporter-like MFS transporter
MDPMPAALPNPASQRRWLVLALLLAITVINFLDRQTLSVLAPRLKEIFGFTNTEYGRIVAAFQFGMMSAEFPMGMLMDRYGVRFGFTFAVLWWSLATGVHAIARNAWHFGLARFWMGTGECGNYSGGIKLVAQWFPRPERTFAIGLFNGGSMIGAAVAPFIIVQLNKYYGWQTAFLVPATLGIVWVVLWRTLYRNPTATEDQSDSSESTAPSSLSLLTYKQTWGLMLLRFLAGPVIQFYWYWLPDYLHSVRHMSLEAIGAITWLPFLIGDFGSMGGGLVAGWIFARGGTPWHARLVTLAIGALCCIGSLGAVMVPSAAVAFAFISIAIFGHTFFSANFFASISDLFPQNAVGRVTGLTGVSGGLGGILFPLLTGVLVDRFSYTPAFTIAAFLPAAGAIALLALSGHMRRVTLRN